VRVGLATSWRCSTVCWRREKVRGALGIMARLSRVRRRKLEEDDGDGASACVQACLLASWIRGSCACKRRKGGEYKRDGARQCTGAPRVVPVHALAWPGRGDHVGLGLWLLLFDLGQCLACSAWSKESL
jgi:hypothetical protein